MIEKGGGPGLSWRTERPMGPEVPLTSAPTGPTRRACRAQLACLALFLVSHPQAGQVAGAPAPPAARSPGLGAPRRIPGTGTHPRFPDEARRLSATGAVILRLTVQEDGSVWDAAVVHCNEPGVGFEQAALDAVRQWGYEPAVHHGTAVPFEIDVTVEFRLARDDALDPDAMAHAVESDRVRRAASEASRAGELDRGDPGARGAPGLAPNDGRAPAAVPGPRRRRDG